MRKLSVGLFISLDGVVQAPGGEAGFEHAGWTMPYWNDEIGQFIGESAMNSDALLLGRVTYQGFAAAFAGQSGPDADMMNNQRKYVVSNTIQSADWVNTTLIRGDAAAEVAKLKQQPGRDIVISGSITLAQSLMRADLIDEYSLLVYPIVLGSGQRLFAEGTPKIPLKLIESRPTSTGVVILRYAPDRSA